MCCFSQPVRHVSKTRIFARPLHPTETPASALLTLAPLPSPATASSAHPHRVSQRPLLRQLLVYAMNLAADEDLAMVLPIPVPPSSPDDAVRFVDLSSCPTFFDQLDVLFPEEFARSFGPAMGAGPAPQAVRLVVHDVGDFEASFVPRIADFGRLDPRFRLPSQVWDALPSYADWGFCVFKLRAKSPSPAAVPPPPAPAIASSPGGIVHRTVDFVARNIGGAPPPPPPPLPPPSRVRDYHPMAFDFPRRDGAPLFFPTLHIHDGAVHDFAEFDHALYCQLGPTPEASPADASPAEAAKLSPPWRRSSAPAGLVMGKARAWLDLDAAVYRREVRGNFPNQDVYVG